MWTQSNGGPLLLLDAASAPHWRGATNLDEPLDPSTDYGRACAAIEDAGADLLGVVTIADTVGLVLGDDPTLPASWCILDGDLVVVRTFASDKITPQLLASFPRLVAWSGRVVEFVVRVGPLVLFDAAFAGDEADAAPAAFEERLPTLMIPCAPGRFTVRSCELELEPDRDVVVLHRLSLSL